MNTRIHRSSPVLGALASLLLLPALALADEGHDHAWSAGRPDGHAPISVMGEHVHGAGDWMLSYRYMFMDMRGNGDGSGDLSRGEVLGQYLVAPTDMTMEMHMLGAMYAPFDQLTIMAMAPLVKKSMNHQTRMGARFHTDTRGIGDIKLSALFQPLKLGGGHSFHLNAGLSLPTGSIDEKGDTPAAQNAPLPYPMQLGSGTVDLMPGLTYLGQRGDLSWGAQTLETLPVGRNSNGYRLGDRYTLTGWLAYRVFDWLSSSIRLEGLKWGNIRGRYDRLNLMMVPTNDPDRRAGERVDLLFGLNVLVPDGTLKGNRLAIEGGFPVYEHLDGPQLKTSWRLTVGWQYAW